VNPTAGQHLAEYVDGLPNLSGAETLISVAIADAAGRPVFALPDAIKIAAATRGGRQVIDGVIFHTDRGSTYTAASFTLLCRESQSACGRGCSALGHVDTGCDRR
jgi:hypothetical protein